MVSNEKASVTKEQNDKHRKVLEALMKLPENKECADCKSKGPRWASVNLGIFVCIQCSGIHRSLGVHISKVRSATLDTWLPEQVAFMQSMGNEKANQYWEEELPPNFNRPKENDRNGLEAFIRAKYEAKRWVPRANRSPLRDDRRSSRDDRRSSREGTSRRANIEEYDRYIVSGKEGGDRYERRHDDGNRERDHDHRSDGFESSRASQSSSHSSGSSSSRTVPNGNPGARLSSIPATPATRVPSDGVSPARSREPSSTLPAIKSPPRPAVPLAATTSKPAPPPQVEAPTNLFDLLSIQDNPSGGSAPTSTATDDDSWANFQSAEAVPAAPAEETKSTAGTSSAAGSSQVTESSGGSTLKNSVTAGLEDLFKGSPDVTAKSEVQTQSPAQQGQPGKDVRQSILSLFETSSMVSPYSAQQQQMAALVAQQQSMYIAAAAAASGMQGSYLQGQQPQTAPKEENGGPATSKAPVVGQVWPMMGGLQVPGLMVSPMAFTNGGLPTAQGSGFVPPPATNPSSGQAHPGLSSVYKAPAAAAPFSQSYGVQGLSVPYGNGVQSAGLTSSYGTSFTSNQPTSQSLNPSSGASYDFSSLTANAFTK
ncbi:hypothetical protein R1sor_015107 [Riccia sorocarpa]|uniref:Arf-GAP domain-containing protein n=1 Tax=Riccia sorocarpa TaxID=122646 RepID=A0ABD3HBL8_9MARC